MYVSVWILLDGLQIIFVLVFVFVLDNVTVGVESRGVALQDESSVASMLDALQRVRL